MLAGNGRLEKTSASADMYLDIKHPGMYRVPPKNVPLHVYTL